MLFSLFNIKYNSFKAWRSLPLELLTLTRVKGT